MHFLTIIVCLFAAIQICSCKHSNKLIAAHIIHRHGDRNIDTVYPNDPYNSDRYWPGGLGELTELGKKQTFQLGQFLRQRYHKLIGDKYSDDKMYYCSTERSRTVNSAKSCAAGLYESSHHLPKIHVVSTEDGYLIDQRTKCARYSKLLDRYLKSRKINRIWKKHRSLIKYLEKHSGRRMNSLADVSKIVDILRVENLREWKLPKWAQKVLKSRNTLEYLVGVYFEAFTHTTEMKKLKAGYLLDKILHHFKKKSELQSERNLYIYSAHDITIVNVLNALNLYHLERPPYASSLHLELYERDSHYYVQILYRKSAGDDTPRALHIPRCGSKCPLDKFYELYKRILPSRSFSSACNT